MKKIVIPFEGDNYPAELLDFISTLHEVAPVQLIAAFVPEIDYSQLWSITGSIASPVLMPQPTETDEDVAIATHSVRVEAFCRTHAIPFHIHTDRLDFALPSLRKEARFADLMVLSSSHFFDKIDTIQPNTYMKEILHTAECPLLVIPGSASLPKNNILAYDGSAASLHAIKQFIYLFPELAPIPTALVHLHEKPSSAIPDRKLIEELASTHFSDFRILDIGLSPDEFFNTWLLAQENPWLICGSYGRSELSRLFSASFVSGLIRQHKIPLFIAHP